MFFAGSCFAEYLHREYETADLRAEFSPFGSIYNPESLAAAAAILCAPADPVDPADCFTGEGTDGRYRHMMFHSLIHAASAEELAAGLNARIAAARAFIETAEAAVLTLGTSIVYRLKTGETVNNCHRLPARDFDRVQLNVDEAAAALQQTINSLQSLNPGLKIILTLSPVRHLRDNAAENSLSKAVLRCAIDTAVKESGGENLWYFPSYEIMLDELRDYRWYADDLCHPAPAAVSYIISNFIESAYSMEFRDFLGRYLKVVRELNHRPFNPDSDEYRKFRTSAEAKQRQLQKERPDLFSPGSV